MRLGASPCTNAGVSAVIRDLLAPHEGCGCVRIVDHLRLADSPVIAMPQAYPPLPIPASAAATGVSVIDTIDFLPTSSNYPGMPLFVLAGQTLGFSLRCTGACGCLSAGLQAGCSPEDQLCSHLHVSLCL